jgi:tRNA wybutosine-synthesizing protein 3
MKTTKTPDQADPSPTGQFARRKQKILSDLAVPEDRYSDASPKGTIDAGIRSLIDAINARAGLVTTSSCAGRVSVYLEGGKGKRRPAPPVLSHQPGVGGKGEDGNGDGDGNGNEATVPASGQGPGASAGGKGGGEWLFVSHDPVSIESLEKEGGLGAVLGLELEAEVGGSSTLPGMTEESARLIHFKFEPMVCCCFSIYASQSGAPS